VTLAVLTKFRGGGGNPASVFFFNIYLKDDIGSIYSIQRKITKLFL
jgi:hypothetical protein